LGAAAKFGASEIPSMTEALLKFGGVAASAKFSVEESAAAIQTLAKFGLEGSEAGVALRNIGLAMTNIKGLPKEAVDGMKAMNINMDLIANTAIPVNERLKEFKKVLEDGVVAEKTFGKENIVAAQRLLEPLLFRYAFMLTPSFQVLFVVRLVRPLQPIDDLPTCPCLVLLF